MSTKQGSGPIELWMRSEVLRNPYPQHYRLRVRIIASSASAFQNLPSWNPLALLHRP